jgi:hypothetical protein
MSNTDYSEFIESKTQRGCLFGIEPQETDNRLFPFQWSMTEWAIRKGRAAIFADCGLGKTLMELEWAKQYYKHTGKPVLVLTPLAVSFQTEREANKFGYDAAVMRDGLSSKMPIIICNYERLDRFSPGDFGAVVCDESSILKSFSGKRSAEIIRFMRKVQYRLLATATAAPNDYIELGTSSEALGEMGHMDMLSKFFRNDQNNIGTRRLYGEAPKWRLKGHSEGPFWRWVTGWARACRKPSDLGFSDDGYILPDLQENTHCVEHSTPRDGYFIPIPASRLDEQREEKRNTINERCEKMASMVDHDRPVVCWCHLNDEGDLLEKIIPDSVQVAGGQSDEKKERLLDDFGSGKSRVLITKPKIGAWGLNWQHCSHVLYFPSHSYEQYYQAVRRCWRFGQKNIVVVDIVHTEGERKIIENLNNKNNKASLMFSNLVQEMNNSMFIKQQTTNPTKIRMPSWMQK